MNDRDFLAARFEESRPHLRAVAYRMLGSGTEADDAVQEAWLRLSRSDASTIDNLGGWLTTVVSRTCLAFAFTIEGGAIIAIALIADPLRLAALDVTILGE